MTYVNISKERNQQLGKDVHVLGTVQLFDESALDTSLGSGIREHMLLYTLTLLTSPMSTDKD